MTAILIIILISIILILIWALFGGKDEETKKIEPDEKASETLRRRSSDKEIEEQFPEDHRRQKRRKDDKDFDPKLQETDYTFKLPYLADDIIPEASRFRVYRRTLLNSEIYAKKGDFNTAISLYEGVKSRINDADTKYKINADIEYLKYYKKKKEEEAKRKELEAKKALQDKESEPSLSSEIKLTINGPVPDTINIGPVPNTINVGVVDFDKVLDTDKIAEKVTKELRNEIDSFKNDIDKLKKLPINETILDESRLISELNNLKDKVADLDSGQKSSTGGGGSSLIKDNKISSFGNEINDLNKTVDDLLKQASDQKPVIVESDQKPIIVETDKKPVLVEAKYTSPIPITIDKKSILDLLDTIPIQRVPDPKKIKEPGLTPLTTGGSSSALKSGDSTPYDQEREKVVEKEKINIDEDENDFELLSEYGKDKDSDDLSDDEIFAKILKQDKPDQDDQSFEILGEKKEQFEEINISDNESATKRREEESFYKSLLKTNKRKKKELPILKVSYDFTKLPEDLSLSREKNIIEYAFYKYKPMLEKAHEFIKKRKVRDAINYYKVVMSQNIPPEFKAMIRKNISDLTEYLEKYLTGD